MLLAFMRLLALLAGSEQRTCTCTKCAESGTALQRRSAASLHASVHISSSKQALTVHTFVNYAS